MNRSLLLLPLLASFLLPACGPTAGDDCKGRGYLCSSEEEALECRNGVWRALPCKGSLGCSELNDSVRCDMSGNVGDDACALSAEGRGLCASDGRTLLECRMGVLVEVRQCSACTMSNTQVVCQP
jgi:hypothetical protein